MLPCPNHFLEKVLLYRWHNADLWAFLQIWKATGDTTRHKGTSLHFYWGWVNWKGKKYPKGTLGGKVSWVEMDTHRNHKVTERKPSDKGDCVLWVNGQGIPTSYKSIKAIATAVSCMPELDGKTWLLKTTHALTTEHEEIKPGLNQQHPPAGSFIVLEEVVWLLMENCHPRSNVP